MFAPDRQGFFPGLWVQFLQDLPNVDRETFNKLENKEDRVDWMYSRPFVKVNNPINHIFGSKIRICMYLHDGIHITHQTKVYTII